MNRRAAILLTMLMGGLLPRRVFAQDPPRRNSTAGRNRGAGSSSEVNKARKPPVDSDEEPQDDSREEPADDVGLQSMPAEAGQRYKQYDISRYTRLDHSQPNPQNAIVEWIFRRTGSPPWHGDKLAALSASRSQIRAYNNSKVLDQTFEVIERFIDAKDDFLTVHIRFVAAVDTRWRYTVYSNLIPVASGPQGQQIWTLDAKNAALTLAQMQLFQGFRLLTEQKLEMVNGQTLTVKTSEMRGFTGGMERESAAGLGYQPKAEQIEEGVTLKFSPLLTFDGDALDAAIDLSANTVKGLHRTRVIAPRQIGPAELSIEVPEVVETRLSQTIKNWKVGQTLLITAGIHPGILQSKSGFLNLRIPGTVPTSTELLVFIDVEPAAPPKRASPRE
jgi:hypothetical protein